jgi:uncharacterized protein YbjT (DUF2867 family)
MVIPVTGAMGFIGSHVVDALTVLGHECVATSHRTALDLGDAVSIEHVSVADRDAMVGIGERHAIDGIVHLADPALARLDDPEDCGDASREPSFHSSRAKVPTARPPTWISPGCRPPPALHRSTTSTGRSRIT